MDRSPVVLQDVRVSEGRKRRVEPPMTPADEAALAARAKAGKHEAMTRLLEIYQHRVYSICLRMVGDREDAADLAQDALTRILLHINQFDGRSAFSTWAIRVTMNTCLSHLRKRRSPNAGRPGTGGRGGEAGRLEGLAAFEEAGGGKSGRGGEPGAAAGVEHDERRQMLAEAMARIPDEARAILILRDVKDLDYEQIGEVTGVPVGTVKSRLFRARAALREAMETLEQGGVLPGPRREER